MARVYLESPQVLANLRSRLLEFDDRWKGLTLQISQEAERLAECVQRRVEECERIVRECERAVAAAEAALRSCESRVERDKNGNERRPNCSGEAAALSRARQALQRALDELRRMKDAQLRLNTGLREYRKKASRLNGHLQKNLPWASTRLETIRQRYQEYLDIEPVYVNMGLGYIGPDTAISLSGLGFVSAAQLFSENDRAKKGQLGESLVMSLVDGDGELRSSDGSIVIPLVRALDLKLSDANTGIDLIGVTTNGVPVPIEVKTGGLDSNHGLESLFGGCSESLDPKTQVRMAGLPSTQSLLDWIQREKGVLPWQREELVDRSQWAEQFVESKEIKNISPERLDSFVNSDISLLQMADGWLYDRWLRTVNEHRDALLVGGVNPRFVDGSNLTNPFSPEWREILSNRVYVQITNSNNSVSDAVMGNVIGRHKSNLVRIVLNEEEKAQ